MSERESLLKSAKDYARKKRREEYLAAKAIEREAKEELKRQTEIQKKLNKEKKDQELLQSLKKGSEIARP